MRKLGVVIASILVVMMIAAVPVFAKAKTTAKITGKYHSIIHYQEGLIKDPMYDLDGKQENKNCSFCIAAELFNKSGKSLEYKICRGTVTYNYTYSATTPKNKTSKFGWYGGYIVTDGDKKNVTGSGYCV